MRFLFAWEFGANLGHLHQMRGPALALVERGHEVFCAVPDVAQAIAVLDDPRLIVVQAPLAVVRRKKDDPAQPFVGYQDGVIPYGFADPRELSARAKVWRGLFAMVKPDLLVTHAAPTALLAARGLLPVCILGTGYHCPPDAAPLPNLIAQQVLSDRELAQLHERERWVVDALNEARCDGAPFGALRDLFDHPQLFTTFPELDHYERPPRGDYFGPQFSTQGQPIEWLENSLRVFAYLRGDLARAVRNQLIEVDNVDAWVAAPTHPAGVLAGDAVHKNNGRRVSLWHVPLALGDAQKADVGITYGSHGVTAALLLGGVPLVLLPQNAEQLQTALRVQKLGAGVVGEPGKPYNIPLLVEAARRCAGAAEAFAAKHSGFDPSKQAKVIAAHLEGLGMVN